ncbi:hypothetical protein NDU88_007570 [Pleurodeles waltl]|uniref:Uncharacterized protein n=1 Tax=Pleurodeles waltl TaxID=8319 RepID=A0AAV7RQH6_PLEWA|nr:hypothetical protein NDU88_007570 [Pleurodeles waltl]
MSGRPRLSRMGEDELGGFIWLVCHFLPLMLEAGGRVIQGYHTEARKIRWEKVRHHMVLVHGTMRNVHQLKHRWADLITREQDLLDHLGVRIGGHVAANMRAADRIHFERRAIRYRHILQVQSGYRRMGRRYHSERASGAWWATPQPPTSVPPTATNDTATRSGPVVPSTSAAMDPPHAARPGPSRVLAAGQSHVPPTAATSSTSAGTQTLPTDPPVDPAAFQALSLKVDKLLRKVDNLTDDMNYVKTRVRDISRTLRRANL